MILEIKTYDHIPGHGIKNWLIKILGMTRTVHIQVNLSGLSYVILQDRPGKVIPSAVLERIVPPHTDMVCLKVSGLDTERLYRRCQDRVTSTRYFVFWWLIGRWFIMRKPYCCTTFACEVLRELGMPVEEDIKPSVLMEQLHEVIRRCRKGSRWEVYRG